MSDVDFSETDPILSVVIDDSDSSIVYNGDWTTDQGSSFNSLGNEGMVWNNTLHGTTTNGSATFNFSGNGVTVYGTVDITDKKTFPQFTCSIDGNSTVAETRPVSSDEISANSYLLCDVSNLSNTSHTLTISPSFNSSLDADSIATFWLDQIQYVPLPSDADSLDDTVLLLQDNHPNVSYSGQWKNNAGFSRYPSTTGSSCSLTFSGTSVALYGVVYEGTPNKASYTIDDGDSTDFTIGSNATVNGFQGGLGFGQQLLINATSLPAGEHTIKITFTGSDAQSATDLVIDYFVITTNPKGQDDISGGSNSTTGSSDSNSTTEVKGHNSTGAIAGGVVGGVVALLLLLGFLLFCLRRPRRNRAADEAQSRPFPLPVSAVPSSALLLASNSREVGQDEKSRPSQSYYTSSESGRTTERDAPSVLSPSQSDQSSSQMQLLPQPSPRVPRIMKHQDSGLRIDPDSEAEAQPPDYVKR